MTQTEWLPDQDSMNFTSTLQFNLTKYFNLQTALSIQTPYVCTFTQQGYAYVNLRCSIPVSNAITELRLFFQAPTNLINFDLNPIFPNTNYYVSSTPNLYYFNASTMGINYYYVLDNLTLSSVGANNYFYYTRYSNNFIMNGRSIYGTSLKRQMLFYDKTSIQLTSNIKTQYAVNGNVTSNTQFTSTLIDVDSGKQFIIVPLGYDSPVTTILAFIGNIKNYFPFINQLEVGLYKKEQRFEWPYGLNDQTMSTNTYSQSILLPQYSVTVKSLKQTIAVNNALPVETQGIMLLNVTFTPLNLESGRKLMIVIAAYVTNSNSGLNEIKFLGADGSVHFSLNTRDISSGGPMSGDLSKVVDYTYFDSPLYQVQTYTVSGLVSTNIFTYTTSIIQQYPTFDLGRVIIQDQIRLTHVEFALNNIDLSLVGCENTIFFNFSMISKGFPVKVVFDMDINKVFRGKWNEEFGMFSVDFSIPSRQFTGQIQYTIFYYGFQYNSTSFSISYGLPKSSYELQVTSTVADRMPPIVVSINRPPIANNIMSWNLTISDPINGFKNGTIYIIGSLNRFNPTVVQLSSNGQMNVFMKTFNIEYQYNCSVYQDYQISMIELFDNNEYRSIYDPFYVRSSVSDNIINPLSSLPGQMNYLSNADPSCPVKTDLAPPTIIQLTDIFNVETFKANRNFSISFTVSDIASPISATISPYCYLHSIQHEVLKTKAIFTATADPKVANYECLYDSTNIPLGFGYPLTSLGLSIHGYTDSKYNFGGQSIVNLQQKLYMYTVPLLFSNPVNSYPLLDKVLEITSDYKLIVLGSFLGFNTTYIIPNITIPGVGSMKPPVIDVNNVIIIFDISSIKNVPIFSLQVFKSAQYSNQITVTNRPIPTSTPPVVIKCPGTPECGGLSNGKCNSIGLCECIIPWSGADCLSQIIVIPQPPIINNTSPGTINDFNTTLPDGEPVQLRTLISVVSLQELAIDGSIVNEIPFIQWVYTNTTSVNNTSIQEYTYTSSFSYNSQTTQVEVQVQYYQNLTTILFANQKLEMLPQTLKYRIQLSPYAFKLRTNTLQLVMSASIQSSSESLNTCSYQETGETTGNTDYFKLQIDTHSLYGRFIKRAIIDNRIQSVSNTILNQTSENTGSLSQSLIGIHIPNYLSSVIIDPDFSILLDTKTTSSIESDQVICNAQSENSTKLSKSQLAGIIIGAVGFFIVSIIVIIYFIYKRKENSILLANFNNKIQNSNNNL
ncbi:EGF-like domain-containing protein [Tieghemostelium lacteum]|uniref:EGF-like domain-containing protein n=1 Tax=Tieghemostelium lacteum TaxID=361077 RepID=A0A152A7Z7_TIELA|nr:EGF-like domain-containing protein [Tieghemostelium lacteum]|eukprot:KYR02359.1 EGF-like domain-containing protein [Tieghemostelium lacteum]